MDDVTLVHVHMRVNSGFDLVEIMGIPSTSGQYHRLWSVRTPPTLPRHAHLVRFSESPISTSPRPFAPMANVKRFTVTASWHARP